MSQSVQAANTTDRVAYKQQKFISHSSEGWEFQDQGANMVVSWWEHSYSSHSWSSFRCHVLHVDRILIRQLCFIEDCFQNDQWLPDFVEEYRYGFSEPSEVRGAGSVYPTLLFNHLYGLGDLTELSSTSALYTSCQIIPGFVLALNDDCSPLSGHVRYTQRKSPVNQ